MKSYKKKNKSKKFQETKETFQGTGFSSPFRGTNNRTIMAELDERYYSNHPITRGMLDSN